MVEYEYVRVKVLSREYGVLSKTKVCIAPSLSCTSAWPVLYHTVDAHPAPAVFYLIIAVRCLESIDVCPCHIRCKPWVF